MNTYVPAGSAVPGTSTASPNVTAVFLSQVSALVLEHRPSIAQTSAAPANKLSDLNLCMKVSPQTKFALDRWAGRDRVTESRDQQPMQNIYSRLQKMAVRCSSTGQEMTLVLKNLYPTSPEGSGASSR
jgi:hypothetical protein